MTQMSRADIGVVGLAVMGQNLILNFNDNGHTVCAYNRTTTKVKNFLENEAKGTNVIGADSVQELVNSLKSPRVIMLMVKAGPPVDNFIEQLLPFLLPGDIIVDGGNSHYLDTERRVREMKDKHGILYVGCGVSGGEEGARNGPSMMPGGNKDAWPFIKSMFQSVSAKVNGNPCCEWLGEGGSGHFVKMVHNGIEYGDMQLICEAFHMMKDAFGMSQPEIANVFEEWNGGELDSFLIQITTDILRYADPKSGAPVLQNIRDATGQKGTGRWTSEASLSLGTPVTLVSEAVFARSLSAMKDERVRASQVLPKPNSKFSGSSSDLIPHIQKALYASKIISYTQGMMMFREASKEFKWNLDCSVIAKLWMGGCIIKSVFLGNIAAAYSKNAQLENLLFDTFFKTSIVECQDSWRKVLCEAILLGIPTPAMSSALAFYDGYRTAKLPANLAQAQRDYFGAHTFEYEDSPGKWHHINWTGEGGTTSSSNYQV